MISCSIYTDFSVQEMTPSPDKRKRDAGEKVTKEIPMPTIAEEEQTPKKSKKKKKKKDKGEEATTS